MKKHLHCILLPVLMTYSSLALSKSETYRCDLTQASFKSLRYETMDNPGLASISFTLVDPVPLDQRSWRRNKSFKGTWKLTLFGSLKEKFGSHLPLEPMEIRVNKDENDPRQGKKNFFSYAGESMAWFHQEGILAEWNPLLYMKGLHHPEYPIEMHVDGRLEEHQALNWRIALPQDACRLED